MTIHYAIRPANPGAHLFHVSCRVDQPDRHGQQFLLPAWVPGSYMIREFARNVIRVVALAGDRRLAVKKLDKHTWQVAAARGPIELVYEVYAAEVSVRTAYLDDMRGFFTGSSVFMLPVGREAEDCRLDILPPEGERFRQWKVLTPLERSAATKPFGFGSYVARDYAELIDCPVELGTFEHAAFTAAGVPHAIAVTGAVARLDIARLQTDLARLCTEHIALFEPESRQPPFDRYLFMTLAVGAGYGGLEHRNSTALICKRDDLPFIGMKDTTEGYRTFLGLASHEYFHAWLIKRIRPSAFVPYDLTSENYTRLLWAFEGITSYYDDLLLVRAGLLTDKQYFDGLSKTLTGVMQRSNRLKQSVADSSFDAWIKYYRQDENAPNSVVSYYQKGALIALALDLTLRTRTDGRRSLDDVLRLMWQQYLASDDYRGVDEDALGDLIELATGQRLHDLVVDWTEGTADIDFGALLAPFGVTVTMQPALEDPRFALLGIKTSGNDPLLVAHVFDGSPAQVVGLAAHDALVAMGGVRVNAANIDSLLARYGTGDDVEIVAFRRDELRTFQLQLATQPPAKFTIGIDPKAPRAASSRRARWLRSSAKGAATE